MARKKTATVAWAARAQPLARPAPPQSAAQPKHQRKSALRALVPSTYRADGEGNAFLRDYKTKWLSKLDFASDVNIESLLTVAFMVLALERDAEAEAIADHLIEHVDVRGMSSSTEDVIAAALHLSSWLKSKRGQDAATLLARARALGRRRAHQDREWLSSEAAAEIRDAVERGKLSHLGSPFAGILRWLNDGAARAKAEAMLAIALAATRTLMK